MIQLSFFIHGTPTPFNPDSVRKGALGGSESACIYLSEALARLDYDVTVYAPRPEDLITIHAKNGVLYREPQDFDTESNNEDEVVIFWRAPQLSLHEGVKKGRYRKILWLHDELYQAPKEAYAAFDKVIVLSQYHAKAIEKYDGYPSNSKNIAFAQNGIDLSMLSPLNENEPRDSHKVVYASSPDRGLKNILDIWGSVKELVPEATLDAFYSWKMFEKKFPEEALELKAQALSLKPLGVTIHGGVSKPELFKAYRNSSVWFYPVVKNFREISCITAMETVACGVQPVVSDTGALRETLAGIGVFKDDLDVLKSELIKALQNPWSFSTRQKMSEAFRAKYDWREVSKVFDRIIKEV